MASPDREADIADQAATWAARTAYGEMTEESRAELDAWLARDRRHGGAYLRARAAAAIMDDAVIRGRPALASDNDNMAEDTGRTGGRWFRRGALAASLVLLAVAAVPIWQKLRPVPAPHVEKVALADGSRAELEEGARITVAMSGTDRRITLLEGEATFHVAKDAARPFVVRSGDVYAQATGTVYSVRRLGHSGGVVHVTEGKVLVWAGDEREQAVLLRAGGSLSLDPGNMAPGTLKPVPASPAPRQLSFDDVPVATAVERFNRSQNAKHIAVDPGLADVRLVGLFRTDDPEQFARAVAAVSGGHVAHEGNRILIKAK